MAAQFQITILGINSALPVFDRHPSAQVVTYDNKSILIDCGEGTQSQLTRYRVKRSKISHVLISHLHGDHCFGLPGLLTSLSLNGRKEPLTIHGPSGLKAWIELTLNISGSHLTYPLTIHEYDTEEENVIEISKHLVVHTFPLKHRVPTMGYKIAEQRVGKNINSEKINEYNLTIEEIKSIKCGEGIVRDGNPIRNEELTKPDELLRAYGYVSDSVYDVAIVPQLKGCTTLYHETTYLDDLKHLAEQRMHTSLGQAVDIARQAEVRQLITGHYSSRYKDISVFETEGKKLWEGVVLGEEGRIYDV